MFGLGNSFTNLKLGMIDDKLVDMLRGITLFSEAAVFDRRVRQFGHTIDGLKSPEGLPKTSFLSDDLFIYDGLLDDTQELAVNDEQVLVSTPRPWSEEMGKVYFAMFAGRQTCRTVREISLWTGVSVEDVQRFLEYMRDQGLVSTDCEGSWKLIWSN